MEKDIQKVFKILSSCETIGQIKTADSCFVNFYNKWKDRLDISDYPYLDRVKDRYIYQTNQKKNYLRTT